MGESAKTRILQVIADKKEIHNPDELRLDVANDSHNIVHVLYRMRRQGLISFDEVHLRRLKHGSSRNSRNKAIPTHITITTQGRKYLDER